MKFIAAVAVSRHASGSANWLKPLDLLEAAVVPLHHAAPFGESLRVRSG
jgi:hypothetical protein